jgi:hypothetical protein
VSRRGQGYKARTKARRDHDLAPGEKLVATYDSECTPCGCVSTMLAGIDCTAVGWTASAGRYHLRCLRCDAKWTRAILGRDPSDRQFLKIFRSHPEERAALAARVRRP